MKRLIPALALCLGLLVTAPAMAETVEVDVTAGNQYSTHIILDGPAVVVVDDTGSMNMTVTLQVSTDGGSTWSVTGDSWTAEGADTLGDGCGLRYRIGVASGDFTSGTATASITGAKAPRR